MQILNSLGQSKNIHITYRLFVIESKAYVN